MNKNKIRIVSFLVYCLFLCGLGIASTAPVKGKVENYKLEIIRLGQAGDLDAALTLLEKMVYGYPGEKEIQASLYYHIANGLYVKSKFEKARKLLDDVARDYDFFNPISSLYARALIRTGDIKKAKDILNDYPNNPSSFTEEFSSETIDIWTAFNLAAAYSLLNKKELALKYLESVVYLYYREWDPQKTFEAIEAESDFDSLRNDKLYLFLRDKAYGKSADEAYLLIGEVLERAHELVKQFYQKSLNKETVLEQLGQLEKRLWSFQTIHVELVEAQLKAGDYIEMAKKNVADEPTSSKYPRKELDKLFEETEKSLKAINPSPQLD